MEKLSQYNIEIIDGENIILFNTLTSGILLLPDEYAALYKNAKTTLNFSLLSIDMYNNLKKAMMIIDESFDELDYLEVMYNINRFKKDTLSLTIAPTLSCNFACPYCFESKSQMKNMDDNTIKALIKFI